MSNQNTDFYLIVGNNTESITSKISTALRSQSNLADSC